MYLTEERQNAWGEILESEKFAPIQDDHRKNVTAAVLDNTAKELDFDIVEANKQADAHQQKLNEAKQKLIAEGVDEATATKQIAESADQANVTGAGIQNYDPVMINMIRRAMPNLLAFDLAGVQPMNMPTGLIFAMRARYTNQTVGEAQFTDSDSSFSGAGTHAGDSSGFTGAFIDALTGGTGAVDSEAGDAMATSALETLGTTSGGSFAEMAFTIEKKTVEAKGRALKAEYSRELEKDLMAVHGMSAEAELSKILAVELTNEINREFVRKINISAVVGAQDTTTAGVFDCAVDSDGRWSVERWKGLIFQIEKEANAIAKATRRGRGNYIICSSNVASAFAMANILDWNPAMAAALNVDDTGNTFAGILNKRYRVYIDPYATIDYVTVGYKGANAWDAGIYYAPYVPMEKMRAEGEDSFQPKIGFKTRYGITANPYVSRAANGTEKAGKGLGYGENDYFRKFAVKNLLPSA